MQNVPISTGPPIVSFCEGIGGRSGSTPMDSAKGSKRAQRGGFLPSTVIGKSPNKLNRIHLTMEPLADSICSAIENDQVVLKGDAKAFGRDFVDRFGAEWGGGRESASRIWSFGCSPNGKGAVSLALSLSLCLSLSVCCGLTE